MEYNPLIQKRKSIRLKEYDYTSSAEYFITICTYNRKYLFGEIVNEEMRLSPLGLIIQEEWLKTKSIHPEIELDEYVIMPNHLHGIIVIKEESKKNTAVGTHSRASLQRKPRSLGSLIAGFKSNTTKRINEMRNTPCSPVCKVDFMIT
jgi:putative transposase